MHIFFITQWYPTPKYPIYGVFIVEQARAVAKLHKVSLLHIQGVNQTLVRPIQITTDQDQENLTVYHLSYRRPILPYTAWLRKYTGARRALDMAYKKYGLPDVMHANVSDTAGVAVVLGRLANTPVVMSEFSSAYGRKLFKRSRIPFMRFFMNRVDLIMPDSDSLAGHIRVYGIHRPMVKVNNVVDTELFFPGAPGEQVTTPSREIAIIARLSKEKAVDLAIQAVGRLHQQGLPVFLHIAGDGPERPRLEELTRELNLSEWITFHGFLPKSELARLLRRSSVFVLSSLWESKPVVILEALSCGLPVVAPALGGIPEVITPAYGELFRPGDLGDLAEKMEKVLSRLEAYDARAIHDYAVENFSQAAVGNRLDRIYRQLLSDRHAFDSREEVL